MLLTKSIHLAHDFALQQGKEGNSSAIILASAYMPGRNDEHTAYQWESRIAVGKVDLDHQVKVANIIITAGWGVRSHHHLSFVLSQHILSDIPLTASAQV